MISLKSTNLLTNRLENTSDYPLNKFTFYVISHKCKNWEDVIYGGSLEYPEAFQNSKPVKELYCCSHGFSL